jgi:hypothetical protein
MKDHREKISNLGSELTGKEMVNQIFNSVPTSLFRDTAAHVMSEVNAIYDGLKLRGEIKVQLQHSLLYHHL